jgi:hypothetical protein
MESAMFDGIRHDDVPAITVAIEKRAAELNVSAHEYVVGVFLGRFPPLKLTDIQKWKDLKLAKQEDAPA